MEYHTFTLYESHMIRVLDVPISCLQIIDQFLKPNRLHWEFDGIWTVVVEHVNIK